MKKKILCFVNCYIPGFRYGGPIRTIKNLVDNLHDEYELKIVCTDRDFLEKKPYNNINADCWNNVGNASVFYASPKKLNFFGMISILKNTSFDLIYFNSLFNYKFSILPLLILKLKLVKSKPCILATRGELSQAALKLKSFKKKIFLFVVKKLKFHQNLIWQASSDFEKKEIISNFEIYSNNVVVAPNLTSPIQKQVGYKKKTTEVFRILFYGRISPMKNLDFLLRSLALVNVPVKLDIIGIKEDLKYFKKCEILKNKLPKNIIVNFNNEIENSKISQISRNFDLFVLPTRGENFGHAIFEVISNGLPAMISDKTLWKSDGNHGLEVIPLSEKKWANAITDWAKLSNSILLERRREALNFASNYVLKSDAVNKTKKLINLALSNKS